MTFIWQNSKKVSKITPLILGGLFYLLTTYVILEKKDNIGMSDKIHFEYTPLSTLISFPRNPKSHDIGAIDTSIKRFGYVNPVIVDTTTGYIVAGHGRVQTLAQMKNSGEKPPNRVEIKNGDWLVPVIYIVMADEYEVMSYIVTDNKLTELGGWDAPTLADVLVELAGAGDGLFEVTGFDGDDLDDLLKTLNPIERGEWANDPYGEYVGLPEYNNENKNPIKRLIVNFNSQADIEKFSQLIGQKITSKTISICYPPRVLENVKRKGYVSE